MNDANELHQLERRALEFSQAARIASYPDESFPEAVSAFANTAHAELQPLAARLRSAWSSWTLDAARSEYLALFDHGPERCPIHETEYGRMRGVAKGNDLADISGFYKAFGVELTEDEQREMPDHFAVELEFYAVLLAKQAYLMEAGAQEGVEIVEDARRKFLTAHLGAFAKALAAQPVLARSELYSAAFELCHALVVEECSQLGISPAPLDGIELGAEAEPMCCGADSSFRMPGPTGA